MRENLVGSSKSNSKKFEKLAALGMYCILPLLSIRMDILTLALERLMSSMSRLVTYYYGGNYKYPS